jgi:hypothetical protein
MRNVVSHQWYRRAAIAVLFLQTVPAAIAQTRPYEAVPGPVILESSSHVVQLDVFVSDSAGRPVHALRKSDFLVTDNGRPRDVRIFSAPSMGISRRHRPRPRRKPFIPIVWVCRIRGL